MTTQAVEVNRFSWGAHHLSGGKTKFGHLLRAHFFDAHLLAGDAWHERQRPCIHGLDHGLMHLLD